MVSRTRNKKGQFSAQGAKFSQPHKIEINNHKDGAYGSFGYESIKSIGRDRRAASSGNAVSHQRNDIRRLRDQARYFQRNNPIFKGMLTQACNFIVNDGFRVQPGSDDAEFNAEAEKLWIDYWVKGKPEVRKVLRGRRIEKQICSELLAVGDTGINKTNRGLIQMIESEQICDARRGGLGDGINKNALGQPTSYNICTYNTDGFLRDSTSIAIPAKDFLFLSDPDRPTAYRSVPPLQASFAMLHRINDTLDAEAIAYQMLSRIVAAVTRTDGAQTAFGESEANELKEGDTDGQLSTRITDMDLAMLFHGEPGEEIKGIDRNIPGKDFPQTIRMFLRIMGIPLGMPLEIILLDVSDTNFSGMRSALELSFQSFRQWQDLIIEESLNPIYDWKILQWVREGKLKNPPPDMLKKAWARPSFPWIDQLKEAQAHGVKVDRGFCTYSETLKSLNLDYEVQIKEREKEILKAIEIAKRIEDETGVVVDWQTFAGMKATPDRGRPPGSEPNNQAGREPNGGS